MNPDFYSLEMIVREWMAGAQGNAAQYMDTVLRTLANEENQ